MEGHRDPTQPTEWINQRIQEGINEALTPIQEQLAAMMQQLSRNTEAMQQMTRSSEAGQQSERLSVPQWNAASSEATGIHTPLETTTISTPNPRRKTLPNPPKFNGQRRTYAAWARQMREKLLMDAGFFGSNRELWYLINSCLDEKTQLAVATFFESAGSDCDYEPSSFIQYLDRTYKDKDLEARASSALRSLKQKETQTFASFLPKFETTLIDAQGALWPDSAKITYLEGALNTRLSRSLATVELPRIYTDWINKVSALSAKIERVDRLHPIEEARHSPTRTAQVPKDKDEDTLMGGVNKVRKEKKKVASSESEASDQEARDTRQCYRCGREGHLFAKCPKRHKKKTKPTTEKVARMKKAPNVDITTESVTSSSEEEVDQRKD
jgi:hypothetical protein